MLPQEETDKKRHRTPWMKNKERQRESPILQNSCVTGGHDTVSLSVDTSSHMIEDWFLVKTLSPSDCSAQGLLLSFILLHSNTYFLIFLTNVLSLSLVAGWICVCFLNKKVCSVFVLFVFYNRSSSSVIQIATRLDGRTVAMSTSSLRRQVKNIVHNYSEAEIKVACLCDYLTFVLLLFYTHLHTFPAYSIFLCTTRHDVTADNLIFPYNIVITPSSG